MGVLESWGGGGGGGGGGATEGCSQGVFSTESLAKFQLVNCMISIAQIWEVKRVACYARVAIGFDPV